MKTPDRFFIVVDFENCHGVKFILPILDENENVQEYRTYKEALDATKDIQICKVFPFKIFNMVSMNWR